MISTSAPAQAATLYEWQPVNKPAPPPEMLMENQKLRTLQDFKGNVVVLNLWATWCTPCLKELPTLDKLEETYAKDGLVVLALSIDTFPFKRLREFIADKKLELPHLAQDRSGVFRRSLVEQGLPITYLIDRNGMMLYKFEGAVDWMAPEYRAKIEQVLKPKGR